jgi:hypothetical protein
MYPLTLRGKRKERRKLVRSRNRTPESRMNGTREFFNSEGHACISARIPLSQTEH